MTTMQLRRANDRGHANHGWLDSHHTFSFADYYDAAHMNFRSLRVINEDRVAGKGGFGTHPHNNMEIVTYVLSGALQHRDSMGNGSVMRSGDVQRMSAGTGVTHSEFNASATEEAHFLQIWLVPDKRNHEPSYEQKAFAPETRQGQLRLVASPDGAEGSVTIHQDARLYAALLDGEEKASHTLAPGRGAWVHVARGSVVLNGTQLHAGDAAAIEEPGALELTQGRGAEVLLFDLA